MRNEIKTIFITGAEGYVGSNILALLSETSYKIYALAINPNLKKFKNIYWIKGSLVSNLNKYLKKSDLIIHCATRGVYKKENKALIFKTNYQDSICFLKNAQKQNCHKWILLGSAGEYGFVKKKLITVKTRLNPNNDYAKSKVLFFNQLKKLKIFKKNKILYLRLFHVYGGNEPKGRLWSSLMHSIKHNYDFHLSSGTEIRDFMHISKASKAIIKSFKCFKLDKPFFKVGHISTAKPILLKNFVITQWKKYNGKNNLLFGKIQNNKFYHSLCSDKKSTII